MSQPAVPIADLSGPHDLPPEIAFLRSHDVASETLAEAARLARRAGVTADEALMRCGLMSEDAFYRALAAEIGLPFAAGDLAVHGWARFPEGILTGLVPLAGSEPLRPEFAYAPRGAQIVQLIESRDRLAPGLSIVAPSTIRDRLLLVRAGPIAALAADGLARLSPAQSYRDGVSVPQWLAAFGLGAAAALLFVYLPVETGLAGSMLLGLAFLGSTALRLAAVLEYVPVAPPRPPPRIPDRDLPVYTILVALHREARIVPKLVRAVAALDYPAPKLDVKFILEADDRETLDALGALRLPGFVEVIVAPPGEPRTKPRALNVALPLARGEYLAVYDAEDVPDPGQLRLAVSLFERAGPDIACLQARLVIDNVADGFLTRMFSIEYATLFDVTNPALMRFDMPVPLGGTSNHFRTRILAGLGGWDAWNVTEDADLGIRLAGAGYRVLDLPSATLEEAPHHLGAWMRQRTRWMKGFLQVSITHSRNPLANLRRFGAARLFGAAAMSFGTVASAFGFPVFMALAIAEILSGNILQAASVPEIIGSAIGTTLFGAGLLALVLPPIVALRRRGWPTLLPFVLLMPVYYGLVSLAAWRGLLELVLAPDRWNKTEHGLAKTSRAGLSQQGPHRSDRMPGTSSGSSRAR